MKARVFTCIGCYEGISYRPSCRVQDLEFRYRSKGSCIFNSVTGGLNLKTFATCVNSSQSAKL